MTEEDLKATAAVFARALAAIERVVAAVSGRPHASPKVMAAADALQVVIAIIDTVKGALATDPTQKVTPEQAKEALERLLHRIESNDREADEAIARRFGKG